MFKKISAVILSVCMVFLMSSCSGNKEPDITGTKRGTINGNLYENKEFSVSFTAPDGWDYYSDKEMVSVLGLSNDEETDESAAALLEQSFAIYDMFCTDEENGSTVNISYEAGKIGEETRFTDADSYLESAKQTIDATIMAMDSIVDSKTEITERTINGVKYNCLDIMMDQGGKFYESMAVKETNGWFAIVTVGTVAESDEEAEEIIGKIFDNVKM